MRRLRSTGERASSFASSGSPFPAAGFFRIGARRKSIEKQSKIAGMRRWRSDVRCMKAPVVRLTTNERERQDFQQKQAQVQVTVHPSRRRRRLKPPPAAGGVNSDLHLRLLLLKILSFPLICRQTDNRSLHAAHVTSPSPHPRDFALLLNALSPGADSKKARGR